MVIEDLIQEEVIVSRVQTTFIELRSGSRLFRLDLEDKKEFKLKAGSSGQLVLAKTHPLLFNYNETWITGYINSKASHPAQCIEEMKGAIVAILEGWRRWTEYVTDPTIHFALDTWKQNVEKGAGKLFQAPQTVAQQILAVCQRNGIDVKIFEQFSIPAPCRVLLLGQAYLIAREFRVKEITGLT